MKRTLGILVALVALSLPAIAQNRTRFGGYINAYDYAYGQNPNVPALINDSNTVSTGAQTLTIRVGSVTAGDGTVFAPLTYPAGALGLPWFTVGGPSNTETVQATAVSCSTPSIQDTCSVTATFTYTHGQGERIYSADFGVNEAVNYMYSTQGSGTVLIDGVWAKAGGTNSILTSYVNPFPTITIEDHRGTATSFLEEQPSTLTAISAPTALTATTVTQPASCPTGATCTWTASQPYFCIAYVDSLGGISPCSTGYQPAGNLTASVPVNIASPATSTGAVGWIAFSGTGTNTEYLLPVASTVGVANGACTLTTLETVIPACAIGSGASFNTLYSNTNMLNPVGAFSTANASNPVFQSHTTFLYEPTGGLPQPFQNNYAQFAANTASQSSTNIAVVGTVDLPIAYNNVIGRTVRVSGKVAATVTTAGTPTVIIALGWQGGYSSGAPKALCTIAGGATTAGTAVLMPFSCTFVVNAIGATAVGTATTEGTGFAGAAGAIIPATDAGNATAVTTLGFFSGNQLFVEFEDNGQASTAAQLIGLHVETLQ